MDPQSLELDDAAWQEIEDFLRNEVSGGCMDEQSTMDGNCAEIACGRAMFDMLPVADNSYESGR